MSDWEKVDVSVGDVWDRKKPIEGELIRIREGVGPNLSMFYTVKTGDGDVGIWGSTVLDTKLRELHLGDKIKIEPLGKTQSPKTGREYNDFDVFYVPDSGYDKAKRVADMLKGEEGDKIDIPEEF